ncbi:4-hydroxy-3-methylbut-2-enyl diphosphate reductase [Bifidobacterium ruminantium]|uniref:4-hydroxy-3-methylbut-2-enyl diphosphate reductase n=1 Tax=Bifidobacterium ruminantium TaxID=78346 RepID=UPI001C21FFD8|nr:4-hydroxy-3-methylbut-2-enyl diphosphate reductase [Bifidobacterium ruminantium]MBU9111320.1 4-hydroxy-3-methylbut-2-enyl diphosphate reductase [Bifidobacterium ruminantium]
MGKRIVLADPRGFCAGVDRAILTVRTILKSADASRADGLPPVYVRRQIVHNRHVVEDLAAQGAVFVQELSEVPDAAAAAGIPIVFSAHGVSPAVKAEAASRGMHVVDATCPLVSKVHREVLRFVKEGYEIIYIGHRGHDEAVGVVGESPEHVHLIEHADDVDSLDFQPGTKLVLLTQTTLSVDETADTIAALKSRFPWLRMPPNSDICYATSNRQSAVKLVAEQSDCVVIVGSANSSNSVRLVEVAQEGLKTRFPVGTAVGAAGLAHRVDDASELDPAWFEGVESVGISSGASVPDELVSGVISALNGMGYRDVSTVETIKENMHFVLPAELRK